jgi:hypothetical protein
MTSAGEGKLSFERDIRPSNDIVKRYTPYTDSARPLR